MDIEVSHVLSTTLDLIHPPSTLLGINMFSLTSWQKFLEFFGSFWVKSESQKALHQKPPIVFTFLVDWNWMHNSKKHKCKLEMDKHCSEHVSKGTTFTLKVDSLQFSGLCCYFHSFTKAWRVAPAISFHQPQQITWGIFASSFFPLTNDDHY